MGTRHMVGVEADKKIRIAEYGQCDGYPSGVGIYIYRFLNNQKNIDKLKQNLPYIIFSDDFADYQNQSSDILSIVANYNPFKPDPLKEFLGITQDQEKPTILCLKNDYDFAYDSLFCEWTYIINLDTNRLEIYEGFQKKPLQPTERFYKETPYDGYYGCKKICELDIYNLPPTETLFIEEVNRNLDILEDE